MNRQRLFKVLFWLVALVLLISVLLSVPLAETLNALRRLTWQQVLLLIAINGLVLALFNARWWAILRGQGHRLPFTALFGYRLATFGVSYFTPGPHFGGEPLQVLLVEKEQQTPRSTAIAAMTLDKSLELLVNFLFLLTGVILIVQQQILDGAAAAGAILVISLILLVPAAYLLALAHGRYPLTWTLVGLGGASIWQGKLAWQERFTDAVDTVRESEDEISELLLSAPATLIFAVLASFAAWLLMIVEFWLMVSFLGVSLSPIQLVIALTAARLAILLFLPAGLGALEASQAIAFGTIGLNPALGISATLLIRARDVLLGGIGLWWGSRKLSDNYLEKEPHGSSKR
jgi:uncharacterized protein (TIRG00374 family)